MKGTPYMDWPQPYLNDFLKDTKEILFIPYAGVTMNYDEYTESVSKALMGSDTRVSGIHSVNDMITAIKDAECIAVGGGNTFHLLAMMQKEGIVGAIHDAVTGGTKYIGWSAGSNVACPTIKTTNDMPIINPESFEALNLIDFQINAHYTTRTIDGHGGESRDLRLKELLTINTDMTVVGLPEGKLLELRGDQWFLKGIDGEKTVLFTGADEKIILKNGAIEL